MTLNRFQSLNFPVGNNLQNDIDDVKNVKTYLNKLGYYQRKVENGYIDREMDEGIFKFQSDNDLKQDGIILPRGETEVIMRKAFLNSLSEENVEEDEGAPEEGTDEDNPKEGASDESDENKCANEEERLDAAQSYYDNKLMALEAAEQSLQQLEEELEEVEKIIADEKNDREESGAKGGAVGKIIGRRFGKWGSKIGGIAGKYVGEGVEYGIDSLSGMTDSELQNKKQDIEGRIKDLQKAIEEKFVPEMEEAQEYLDLAKESLVSCQLR